MEELDFEEDAFHQIEEDSDDVSDEEWMRANIKRHSGMVIFYER
jgi:hypothetical protein